MQGKKIKSRKRRYQSGLKKVDEPRVRSGAEMGGAIAKSTAAGAAAGSVVPGWGTAIGAAVGAGAGLTSQLVGKKKDQAALREAEKYNKLVDGVEDREFDRTVQNRYIARKGKGNDQSVAESSVEFEGTKEGREIHGKPTYDKKGKLVNFRVKNIAPDATHEQSKGKNNAALIPTKEGKYDKRLPKEVRDKEALEDEDVILPTQDGKKYKKAIKNIKRVNAGDSKAGEDLSKDINKLPTDEDYGYEDKKSMKGKNRYRVGKKYDLPDIDPNGPMGKPSGGGGGDKGKEGDVKTKEPRNKKGGSVNDPSDSVNSALKYTSIANNYLKGNEEIEGPTERYLKSEEYKYTRDTALEERAITESRNAANMQARGKATTAGQANQYARSIQRNSDDANAALNDRETKVRRDNENRNVDVRRSDAATNLQLANTYEDSRYRAKAVRDAYGNVGASETASIAQKNEKARYQKSLDRRREIQDAKTAKLMRDQKNYITVEDEDGSTKTYFKGSKEYQDYIDSH